MRGNEIVVSFDPRGLKVEGVIGAGLTPKPGTIMQLQVGTALVGGRHTWELYAPGTDGAKPKGPMIVLVQDYLQGRTADDAYAAGERAFGYIPLAGDELNLRLKDIAGTGDDHTKGEVLIVDDASGLLIATTGSPDTKVAILLETVTDPVAETLVWCQWTGF